MNVIEAKIAQLKKIYNDDLKTLHEKFFWAKESAIKSKSTDIRFKTKFNISHESMARFKMDINTNGYSVVSEQIIFDDGGGYDSWKEVIIRKMI